jgi:hypothetical protein
MTTDSSTTTLLLSTMNMTLVDKSKGSLEV